MQGIIVTPSGDVWAVDTTNAQLAYFPKGDPSLAKLLCQNPTGDMLKNPCKLLAPFALAIDQKDNIWVTNLFGDHVTRISASDPSKVDTFKAGYSGSGLAVDSLRNVWITNKFGFRPKSTRTWRPAKHRRGDAPKGAPSGYRVRLVSFRSSVCFSIFAHLTAIATNVYSIAVAPRLVFAQPRSFASATRRPAATVLVDEFDARGRSLLASGN